MLSVNGLRMGKVMATVDQFSARLRQATAQLTTGFVLLPESVALRPS